MRSNLCHYVNKWEKELNIPLLEKSADKPLVEYVKEAFKSLEILKPIKITGFDYTEKESEIDINNYVFRRDKKKKKKERYGIKAIGDDRVGRLTVHIELALPDTNPSTKAHEYKIHNISKSILIPLQDENGYYVIKGKKYYIIYQMVEKSIYNVGNRISLKSLMPVDVRRIPKVVQDIDGVEYKLPLYTVVVVNRTIPAMLFYMSKGIKYALDYLNLDGIIEFIDKIETKDDSKIYFQLSNSCYMQVDREIFDKYTFVKSVVMGIIHISSNRVNLTNLNDKAYWIKKLANPANYEKGLTVLKYFDRLVDVTTSNILKIPEYYKGGSYSVVKWVMQHFNELRLKDNNDINNKRLRCNETISALLTTKFSERLKRVISLGEKANADNYLEIFRFPGDILIQQMQSSGILRYDDEVNDMSIWSKLKETTKGPHAMGEKNSNGVGIKVRDIHPSMLGNIDIIVCGNSDPGTSRTLSPFAKIQGLHFDASIEPSDFYYKISKEVNDKCKRNGDISVMVEFDNPTDFYKYISELEKFNNENISISGTSREGHYDVVLGRTIDMDDSSKPQTINLAKKKYNENGEVEEETKDGE
nr:MAG TPA: DNA-directed RNA polymerase subunit alpha [Caudoviricetes sp.]